MNAAIGYRCLQSVSLVYAATPILIFVLGWLKPLFGFPLALIVMVAVLLAIRSGWRNTGPVPPDSVKEQGVRWSLPFRYAIILLLVAGFVLLSGIGGYAYLTIDYYKHNAFLRDLTAGPWPLAYASTGADNQPGMLVTYIAYYLPPALFGKWMGWEAASHFSFLWAVTGVFLAVLWFLQCVKKHAVLFALMFLCFSGVDVLGEILLNGWDHLMSMPASIDFWGVQYAVGAGRKFTNGEFLIYAANYTYLTDGPHHVIPGWIPVFMLLHDAIYRKSSARLAFLWALMPLTSAFVAVGMAPFVLLGFLTTRFKDARSFANLVAAPLLLLVAGLFFLSNNGEYPKGWLWEFQDLASTWPFLFVFYLVEFGLFLAFRPSIRADHYRSLRTWWYSAIVMLLLLPLYRLGASADFMNKGAITAFVILQVVLGVSLAATTTAENRTRHWPLIVLLLLGALTPLGAIVRAWDHGLQFHPLPWRQITRVDELEPKEFAAQLFSDGDSFFWRRLAKPVQYMEPEPHTVLQSWNFAQLDQSQWQWAFPEPALPQAEGAVVRLSGSGTLVRLSDANFEAGDVSAVAVTLSVGQTTQSDSAALPVKLSLLWARDQDLTPTNQGWPFDLRRQKWFQPDAAQHLARAAEAQTWRGVIRDLAINIYLPEEGQDLYEVTIHRIDLLSRSPASEQDSDSS